MFNFTVETNFIIDIQARNFPRISEIEPIIREFHLITIDNFLSEDSVSVTDTVTPSWVVHCGQGIHETSS